MTTNQAHIPDGTWTLDPNRTTVSVSVKKLGMLNVAATLDLIDGTVRVSDGQVTSADAQVSAASYRSPSAKRNEHVTGSDFLDATTHPEIAFSASNADQVTDSYIVDGSISVKGKSFPLSFDVLDVTTDATVASFRATARVDRNAIGIDKMPGFIIAKMLDLTVDAHAQRRDHGDEAEA